MRLIVTLLAFAGIAYSQKASTGAAYSSAGDLAKRHVAAINSARTPVSTSIGDDTCVNLPDCPEEPLIESQLQAETSIAVDSTGQHIVIGFNDFRGFTATTTSVSGFSYSDDGGVTFIDGGQLPTGPTTTVGGQVVPQIFGDPDVKYLGACNFVYASILVKAFSATTVVQTMGVHRSTDCGHTWSGPFEVTAATNPGGVVDGTTGAPRDDADKELGDVDPETGRYGLCWTNFGASPEISCTFSDNILAGAPPTFSARKLIAAAAADGQGSSTRFAGNGSPNAYVAWSRFPGTLGGYANNIGFARSTDNGVTWSAPINLTTDFLTMDQVLGDDRVNNFPSLAVDKSPGTFSGNVYVVYSNNNLLDGADVVFQKSVNGGISFSAPLSLNAAPGADRAQWFPFVTVDPQSGRVWVYYYDQGVASSGDLTQVTYMFSDNGGTTWTRPAAVTDRPFKAGWGNDTSQPNLGDYIQSVAQAGFLYSAYAATKLLGFADGQPSTSMTTPDVVFTKVPGVAPPSLRPGAVTFTDSGGDGNIDPGDVVHVKIPLLNYVTNLLNAASITGISAVLNSPTPGISVTQAASAYPNIAPGATATNTADFILQVAPAFVAGTPIELLLTVTTAQGPLTIPVTLQTGTPNFTTLLSENFDGVGAGSLPAGWAAAHGAGANTVPWTTSSSFATTLCGTSNKAFHTNANDGPAGGRPSRFERLFSPIFTVPANAQYLTVEFDVCYDTEDDVVLPHLAYDGFFLRLTDQTAGRTLRSVLAEAFDQDFTTGAIQHYPKEFPRSSDPAYFPDMSAWAGFSNGTQHVRMRFPGTEGSRIQLRFEFAQDGGGICSDVRPGHACGVTIDNVLVRSVISGAGVTPGVSAPAISKAFVPSTIAPNATSVLTLTITNPNATASLTGVGFVDTLPAGLLVAAVPGLTTTCTGGTVSAVAGSNTVSLSGATLGAASTCRLTVNVTAPEGTYTNSVAVTSANGGAGNTASDTLFAATVPAFTKTFGLVSIGVNGVTSVTFTLFNPNRILTLHGLQFTDTLPAGLVVATPNGLKGSCDSGSITATSGSNSITLSGAALAPQTGCTFSVDVRANGAAVGSLTNTASAVSSTEAAASALATATLFVGDSLLMSYAANLSVGDSFVDITNAGSLGAALQSGTTAQITGAICANIYAFTADEQLVSCCSCPVTPGGLVSLSAKSDLASNTLTPAVPTSLVIKILATAPVAGSCNNSAAAVGAAPLALGLKAFGTTIHATPDTGVYGVTETPFLAGRLSAGDLSRIGNLCNFILANGSGFGVCRSCRLGGLGGSRQ